MSAPRPSSRIGQVGGCDVFGLGSRDGLHQSAAPDDGVNLGEGSYPVRVPRPGWAQCSAEEWWDAAAEATKTAVGSRGAQVNIPRGRLVVRWCEPGIVTGAAKSFDSPCYTTFRDEETARFC